MIASMTGFARAEGHCDGLSWTWELRSVNARGLDLRWRLPNGFDGLELAGRQRVSAAIKRGSITIGLLLNGSLSQPEIRLNEQVLDRVAALLPDLRRRFPEAPPLRIEGLLALRGVIEVTDVPPSAERRAEVEREMLASLDRAIVALIQARCDEGERLALVLRGQLQRIGSLCDQALQLAALQPAAIHAKLVAAVQALLDATPALAAERLSQEAALLAVKADPCEELDRLRAHTAAGRAMLDEGGPIGRQLDFLCQELNREANTLCAKSSDLELTRIGIDLKTTIDQLREQVQNIE